MNVNVHTFKDIVPRPGHSYVPRLLLWLLCLGECLHILCNLLVTEGNRPCCFITVPWRFIFINLVHLPTHPSVCSNVILNTTERLKRPNSSLKTFFFIERTQKNVPETLTAVSKEEALTHLVWWSIIGISVQPAKGAPWKGQCVECITLGRLFKTKSTI